MIKSKCFALGAACLIGGHVLVANACNTMLDQINNSYAFGFAIFNLDYKEIFLPTDDSRLKSTEAGNILGSTINIKKVFFDRVYTDFFVDYYRGVLTYDGVSRDYPYYPIVGDTHHEFLGLEGKVGYILSPFEENSFQFIPYTGVGYRYWDRSYNSANNKEQYHNYKAIIGVKLNWLCSEQLLLSAYAEGGRTFGSQMKIYHNGYKFDLGNKDIYGAGLEMNYKILEGLFIEGFVKYNQFGYGRSETKNGICEPESKTREIKYGIGLRYSWLS